MQLIINNEPYTADIPPFDRARWKRHGDLYNLELLQDSEVVLTFHDITVRDKGNYQIDSGTIDELDTAALLEGFALALAEEYRDA